MKRDFLKIRKRLIVGCLAAAIAVAQPVSSVFANPHYDRRDTVAEEEFIYSARTSGTESSRKKVNSKAWKKINGVCYNGSGEIIPGAITRGMDVSEWQGNIDWKQVKRSDIDFAFVRISYGLTHEDYTYDENMTNAELAGVPTGTYVYSTALSTTTALKEAQLAISKMQGYKVSYPVVYDLEYAKASKLSAKTVSEMALTFCNEVRRAGYYPMVYCNTNWYDNYIDWSLLSGVDVWIARYGDTIQAPDKERYNYTIWQEEYEGAHMEHMIAEKLLEIALKKEYGINLYNEPRAEGEHGKPFLSYRPSLHYNISHSGKYVVCILADQEVGIDVQIHCRANYERMLRRMVPREQYLEILSDINVEKKFFEQWVLREAYIKWTGEGLSRDMRTISMDEGSHMLLDMEDGYSGAVWAMNPMEINWKYEDIILG